MMCISLNRKGMGSEQEHEEDQDIPRSERGDRDPCDGGDGEGFERMQEEHC